MAKAYCDYCEAELEPSREFIYEMDSQNFVDDEEWLEAIRSVPAYHGEPLRVCKKCYESIQRNKTEMNSDLAEDDYEQWAAFRWIAGAFAVIAAWIVGDIIISFFRGN